MYIYGYIYMDMDLHIGMNIYMDIFTCIFPHIDLFSLNVAHIYLFTCIARLLFTNINTHRFIYIYFANLGALCFIISSYIYVYAFHWVSSLCITYIVYFLLCLRSLLSLCWSHFTFFGYEEFNITFFFF